MREFVKDGTVEGFQLWSPYNEGWLLPTLQVGLKDGFDDQHGRRNAVPNNSTFTINEGNSINTRR
jgi:rhamnose transport system substrate-binding protein